MSISNFATLLQTQGIVFYTKKTNTTKILDISMFKRMACTMKEPNNKLINNADTLVIFTGFTNVSNKFLLMVDFDNLDNPKNKEMYEVFNKFLEDKKIDTYYEKTMRDGYHYFFITDTLFSSSTKIIKNNITYDIDIRGQGGKSLSYGTKYEKLKVIPGNTNSCKNIIFAKLPKELIEILNLNIYNEERVKIRNKDYEKPRKIFNNTNSVISNDFMNIQTLDNILDTNLDTNFKKAKYILQQLSNINPKYYSDYQEWRNIGFALGTLANEEPIFENKYLELYFSFSAQYKYWNTECYNMANNIFYSSNNTITLGTLIYKLKEYDDLYNQYKDVATLGYFDDMVNSPTHGSVANYYYSLFPDKYIFDDTNNKWYILHDTNIWELLKEYSRRIRIEIKNVISTIIINKKRVLNNDNNDDKQKAIKYQKVLDKLNTEDFLKNTYGALKDNYLKFNVKFDTSQYLFAFKNGICFDFSNNSKTIRKILPSDYISIHSGYDYFEPNNEDIEYVNKFIYSLFENNDELSFIIKSISNVLYGSNKYQKCFFFIGIGANGKSVLLTLMENTFGNYSMKASSTFFTKPEKDALVSPELIQCKNKRLLHISEPNPNDKIQQSRYKRFTATIEFENDKPIDVNLHDILSTDKMSMAFAHILYNNFSHNYDPASHLPPSSKNILNEFISANDHLHDFLTSNEIIADRNNKNIRIPITTLYDIYKDYHNRLYNNDPTSKALGLRKFTEAIVNKGFIKNRINTTFIIGIKKNTNDIEFNRKDEEEDIKEEVDM